MQLKYSYFYFIITYRRSYYVVIFVTDLPMTLYTKRMKLLLVYGVLPPISKKVRSPNLLEDFKGI
jgi:hypothetical protein